MTTAVPEGQSIPEGRTKPWGTAQALLAAKDEVVGPFAVINADDFYGAQAYELIAKFLGKPKTTDKMRGGLVAYLLGNTLSDHGSVFPWSVYSRL